MRILYFGLLPAFSGIALQVACTKPAPQVHIFKMGDKVQAGPLIYDILEADWHTKLGEGLDVRLPTHRFLIVRLSVTNSGAEVASAPALKLIGASGEVYSESIDRQGVPNALGLVRSLKPTDTLEGRVLFDVESKSYKLKLDDDSDPSKIVMVDIPLRFGVGTPVE